MATDKQAALDSIKAKAAEVEQFLSTLHPASDTERRYLATAQRDITTGFMWAERALNGYAPG